MAETLKDLYTKLEKANIKVPDYPTFEKKYGVEGGADILYNKLNSANVKVPDLNTFKSKYFSSISTPPKENIIIPTGKTVEGIPTVTLGQENPITPSKWEDTFAGVVSLKETKDRLNSIPYSGTSEATAYDLLKESTIGKLIYGESDKKYAKDSAKLTFEEPKNIEEAVFKNSARKIGYSTESLYNDGFVDYSALEQVNQQFQKDKQIAKDIVDKKPFAQEEFAKKGYTTPDEEANAISKIYEENTAGLKNEKKEVRDLINHYASLIDSYKKIEGQKSLYKHGLVSPGSIPKEWFEKDFLEESKKLEEQIKQLEEKALQLEEDGNSIKAYYSKPIFKNGVTMTTFEKTPKELQALPPEKLIFGLIKDYTNANNIDNNTLRQAKLINAETTAEGGKLYDVLTKPVWTTGDYFDKAKFINIKPEALQKDGNAALDWAVKLMQQNINSLGKELDKYDKLPKNYVENKIKSGEFNEEDAKNFVEEYTKKVESFNDKNKALKTVINTGEQFFGDLKRFDYYKATQDKLAKDFNFKQDFVGAAREGSLDNLVDALNYGQQKYAQVQSKLGIISPEQEVAKYLKIASDRDFDYMRYTPDYIKNMQFIEKDPKTGENKLNPRALGHSMIKTTVESYMLYLTGLGISKATGLSRLAGTNKVGDYIAGHAGILPASELYIQPDMFDEAMDKYENGEISLNQLRTLPDYQAGIEGLTEMLFTPEGTVLTNLLTTDSKKLALKTFLKSATGKDVVKTFGKNATKAVTEGTLMGLGEGWEEVLGNIFNDVYNYNIKADNPDYKYTTQNTLDNNLTTIGNTFVSMLPTMLFGAGTTYLNESSGAVPKTTFYEVAQNPDEFAKYAKDFVYNSSSIKKQFPTKSKDEVWDIVKNTYTSLANTYKQALPVLAKLDTEHEKIEYFTAIQTINSLGKKPELSKKEEGELNKSLEYISEVNNRVATLDALKEVNPIQFLAKKIESGIESFEYNSQDISILSTIGKSLDNSLKEFENKKGYEKLVDKIKEKITLVNTNIEKLQNKPITTTQESLINEPKQEEITVLTEEVDYNTISDEDYAYKVLNLPKEEIEDLQASGELQEKVKTDRVQKEKIKQITSEFEEAKNLQGEERKDTLTDLSIQAAEEGLFDLASQIDEFKDNESTVKIGNIDFPINAKVIYDGKEWEVIAVGNTGKLVKGNTTVIPSDPENIKLKEEVKFIEGNELADAFGVQPVQEEPTQEISTNNIEAKKADIEKLEKEKQKILKPLIEEKEQIEKEIEEIEKDSKSSKTNSQEIESLKEKIKDLRNTDGTIPENKLNEFRSLRKQIQFLESDILHNINKAINEFISDNNLTEKDKKLIYALAEIRDNFQEVIDEFNEKRNSNYTLSEIMTFFGSSFNLQESIETETETDNKKAHEYENKLLEGNGFKANEDYTADELNDFVQKHGSKQVKFIWNLIKAVAQKLGVTTRFMLQGNSKIPVGAAGHYLNGKIENRASLFSHPESAARIIVHELVHGVTTYILKAVEQNNTKILSKLTTRQLKAVEKLNALFDELKKDKEFDDTYGTKNTHELLAELTNENFVDKLKSKNVFEKILEAIFEIFNIPFNAYNESVKILEDLISNPLEDNRYEGSLGEGYSLYSKSESTKLQQLKQKLAEVNKKIDAITKRFDAQIAQKQSELKALEEQSTSAKKAYIERRRQELESSREILTLYNLTKPITEDSKEIISKIEEANKLRKEAKVKSEQAAKETNEEKRIALNSDAASLNEKAQILDKEVKASRDSVINNTPIKQAITSAKILGQKLLNKIKLAAKSNEWVSSMPISKEEFTKFEDAIKRLSVKNMGEVTSNSEVIPDILLIEEINAKYDAELKALKQPKVEKEEIPVIEPTTVIEENPIIEETPVVNTPEAKQEAKNNKKQLDNPVNPFRNTYFERGSVFANVITNIFNSKNKEDYFVTVTSSQNIPWEQLPQSAKEYFKENDSKKRIEDKGKYLVITDKEGKPFEFNPDGTKNNEKGAWAIDVFPVTKSETELKDGRFEPTNIDLEKQGKTREWFLEQVKKIHEARQSNEPITYTISNIHQGGYEVVKNESIPIKQSLDGKNAIVTLQGGKAFFQIEGESTPNEINRPLFTQNQIDTILHIVSNKGTNQTDTKEKQQFVTKLVGSNFYRKVDGKKLSLYFDFNKGLLIPKVKYEGDVDFTIITNEQLAEILAKITPNIDKLLLDSNLPFNNYTFNGKTVSKKVYNSYSDFILDTFYTYNNVSSTEITPEYYLEVGEPVNSDSNKIEQASQEVEESLLITDIERRIELSKIVDLDTGVSDDDVNAVQSEPGVQVTYYLPKGKTIDGRDISTIPRGSINRYTTETKVFYGFEEAEQQAKDWIKSKYDAELKDSKQPIEKKEVTPTITQDSPVQKTKTERKKYKIDDDFDFKSILGDLKRSKNLITQVTKEQELKAKEWFDTNPISQHINYRDFRNIVNSDAFATWSGSALTLWKDAKFTDLYHESWHEFSQLYLTKAQKIALYNEAMQTESGKKALEDYAGEIGKSVSELTDIEKYFAIEEMIGEDFLKYVLSNQELILDNRPKRNTIFRKIFNFIKELFTGKTDLQGYYERLYTGNLNNYKRNLDNAFFGTLNKGIEGVVNGEARNLSNEETTQLYEGIDAIFGRIFEASKKPITLIFEDNNVIPLVYKGILNYFKTQYNNAIDRQSNLDTDSFEYEEEQKVLDNLEFILQNWNEIIAKHKRYSNFFNISRDNIKFDEEGNLVDTSDLSEEVDENNLRDASIVKNENISSKEAASNETIYLVATLSKSKNVDKNTFLPMVDKLVDFKTTWDVLTKHLENTLEYNELIDKIKNLSTKYPWANDLLDRLPDPNKELLSDAEQRLKSAFLRDIGKPKVDTYELVLRVDGKSISTTYNKAVATDEKKLKDKWNNNFATLTPLTNPFIKEDESGTYLDTVEVKNTYESAFPRVLSTYNNLDKNKLFTDRLAFISNLGIEFSEEALSSPEFFKFITRQNSPITDLYKLFTVLSESTPKSYNPIKNLSDLKLDSKLHSNIEYFYKTLVKIVKEELKYSDTLFTQSVKNAENNTVWQIREWNYISKVYNALNDINKYPTYQSLINEPWLKQFSVNSNPYVKGVFLNTLFNLETGERRKDRNGNYAKIELQDYNGITVDLKKGIKNEGKTTTGLTDFEKLVQNFNTLLLYGVQEHLRYGDKSSSYATHISHIYNPVTNQLENRSLIVPIDEFIDAETNTVIIPGLALDYLKESLKAELIPMKMNYQSNFGNNWKYYKDNIKDLGLFEGMLSKETKNALMEEFVKSPDSNINEVISKLSKKIDTDLSVYLRGEKKKLTKLLSHKKLSSSDFISAKLLKQGTVDQLHAAYVVNSLLYNIEHTKLVTGDPRFYKAKGGKKDPFKRFSQFTAGGTLFLTDEQTNKYIQSKGRAIKDAVAKKLNITIAPKIATGMINSVIFNDATYNSEALRKQYTDYFLSKGYSQEYIDNLLKKYEDITEADGQGYTTLDELRESKLRAGSSHWTKAHEIAYQKEADFLAGKTTEGMSEEELVLFVPQKWQYSGTTIDNGFTVPVFYKFSVAPLIPSMIKGTSFEQIHDNLIKQNIGLALFESGSKHSAILNEDGKFNPFYSNYSERTPFEGEYTVNPIFYNYLKEQVNVEPKLKGKVPFSTQMRKLLHLNLFKEGKPIHPRAVELEKKFADVVDKLISLEKENVISQMGATLKDNVYTFDAKKLQEFFQTEFEKRGLSDEVIDYFQVGENGQFTYPLDASNRRDKIEKIIYSIANRRLVQQKVNGEALIQLAATGFELNSDKFKEVKEDAGLPFYRVVDGVTQAMKVKIAFSDKWKPLLKLKHPDNQPINTLDRLNEAIKDEKWLKEHYKKITIVGVRIPVQGLNSQEFMEVYHFLPESAGNVIIVSPYLVAKSGGDFDIDKLTIFFPNLNNEGGLYDLTSEEQIEKKYNSLIKEYRKAVSQGKDEAVDKLISAIFNVSAEKLEKERKQELIEEIFGDNKIPSFEKFKAYNLKKAYENELVDIIRDTLSLEENFEQLITPNDTDLLEELAQKLKELDSDKPKNTWTELVEFQEIARQFKSNLVGKYNLAIAAVWNTFFALSQRGGLTLNDYYINTTSTGKKETIPVRINLPHNTSDGKVSLSGLMDVDNQHKISRIFEQAINGFVDIAKDDWIFFINGVKEIVPTMLFTAAAGVNNKNMIAFFNQPIIKDYVKEVQTYRNLFVAIQDAVNNSEDFQYGTRKALENMFIEKGDAITNKTLLQLFNKFKADYEEFNKVTKKPNESKQAFKARQTIPSINKNKSFKALLQAFQLEASKNKELFTTEKLNQSIFDNKQFTAEEELTILAHFEELKQLAQKVSNLQRSLNADTKKASDSTSIYDRKQRYKDVVDTKLFPEEALNKMFNESTVKAFTNTSTGFDAFVGDLFTNLLEITNNPTFNKITRQLVQLDNTLKFEFKSTNADALSKVLKNDFITYLYQNNVFWEDSLDLVAKKVGELFKPKTSLFNELIALKLKYPDLSDDFPILNQLVSDKKGALVNIKLKSRLSDRDELNSAVYQIRQLLHFNNPSYTQEEQLEVQNFAKKFTKFAIIQSGLNPSIFNLMDLIPNEEYTKGIAPFIQSFKQILDGDESLAKVEISKFYNRFRTNNPTFYQEVTDDEGSKLGNYDNTRGKNYLVQSSLDLTGKKKIASDAKELEYLTVVPTKVELSKSTNSATMRNNPNSLILVENNAQLTATKGLKETNYASIITKEAISKPLVDENLLKNQEIIDIFIKNIIDKSKEFTNITFNENGYGQHLLPNNPKTFDYLSHQLYKYFKFTNPNFNPLDSDIMNQEQPTTEETPTQVVDKNQITNNDKIIWGHPTIGKSYLKEKGDNSFITLDDDYANEVNAFIDKHRGKETRQEYKGRKPKEYNEFMLNLFDRLKVQAKKEGKKLFVSNTNILKERMSEFDKVITMSKEEFKKRFDERGATYGFEDWKSDIDTTISKVDKSKVISTTGYLSDLLEGSKQDIEGFKQFVNKNTTQVVDKNQIIFKTGKGSVYTYLPDGRIQRFKTVENKQYDPQDLIVFVKFKNSEQEQNFLAGVQDRERSGTKVYVIDKQGNKYSKNADIKNKDVVLALVDTKTNKVIDTVETKKEPTIGYNTYDERRYVENGEPMRSMHIGNKVTEILNNKTVDKNQLQKQNVKGIEINSYQTGLGNSLTNVHYAKNGKSTFDIIPSDKSLKLTQAAKAKWGESVEAWYKSNNAQTKGIPEGIEGDKYDFNLMVGLITDKLTQYPNLVEQINQNGGLEFLQNSTHTMGNGRWSSKNPKNMFMNSLIQAYNNTSQVVDNGIDTNRKKLAKETNIGDIFYDSVGNLVQRISLDDYRQYSKIPESTSGVKVKILKELVEIAVPNANPKLSPTTKKELIDVKENKVNTLFENSKITQELKPNVVDSSKEINPEDLGLNTDLSQEDAKC